MSTLNLTLAPLLPLVLVLVLVLALTLLLALEQREGQKCKFVIGNCTQ